MKYRHLPALFATLLTAACAQLPQSTHWSAVYTADQLPTQASTLLPEPFVGGDKLPASGDASATVRYGLSDDPEHSGNKLFWFFTSKAAEKGSLKINLREPQPTEATLLFRSKIADQPCGIDFELDSPISRARVRLLKDGSGNTRILIDDPVTAGTAKYNSASIPLDVSRWHTYRLSMSQGNTFNLYVDENPVPVIANFVTASTKHTHFIRIGDASDDFVTAGSLDWLAWDIGHAKAPDGQLPANVIVDAPGSGR